MIHSFVLVWAEFRRVISGNCSFLLQAPTLRWDTEFLPETIFFTHQYKIAIS